MPQIKNQFLIQNSLREKCLNTEFFLVRISALSDWMRRGTPHAGSQCGEIRTRKYSVFGHFSRSDCSHFNVFNKPRKPARSESRQSNARQIEMTTILERFNTLVTYFMTFGFQLSCIFSEEIGSVRALLFLLHSGSSRIKIQDINFVVITCWIPTTVKKRLWHRWFPVNFAKFLRTAFSYRTPSVAASESCHWYSEQSCHCGEELGMN